MLPTNWDYNGTSYTNLGVFYATLAGLLAGLGVGKITEYYTGTGTKPVTSIVKQSETMTNGKTLILDNTKWANSKNTLKIQRRFLRTQGWAQINIRSCKSIVLK